MTAGEGIAYFAGLTAASTAIIQYLKNKNGDKRDDFNTLKQGYLELYNAKNQEYEQIKTDIELIKQDIDGNDKARKELLAIISPYELKMELLSREIDGIEEAKLAEVIAEMLDVLSNLKDFL